MKYTTSSYVITLKLATNYNDIKALEKRYHIAEIIYNSVIKYARKQYKKLLLDPGYKNAKGKDRSKLIEEYNLTEFQLFKYVKIIGKKYKKYLDSKVVQNIAKYAYVSVRKLLYGNGKHLHFKKYGELDTISTDTNKNKLQYINGVVRFNNLKIKVRNKDLNNPYIKEALNDRIKFIRIKRLIFNGGYHYYVQLIMEGIPPLKKKEDVKGNVGIDIGPSTIAVSSNTSCILNELSPKANDYNKKINLILQKMDISKRKSNPQNYNSDGTIKKGKKKWLYSNNYKALKRKVKTLYRRKSAYIKQSHEILSNEILSLGNNVFVENMNFKTLQRKSKNTQRQEKITTVVDSKGNEKQIHKYKKKKRFGKSLNNKAPAMLVSIIDRKLHYLNKEIHKVDTKQFKASQYNHITNTYEKKKLYERENIINNIWIQRDLYSAFLLMNSKDNLKSTDREKCINTFNNFIKLHNECIANIKLNNIKHPKSFGF
jgi:hypothetical protein